MSFHSAAGEDKKRLKLEREVRELLLQTGDHHLRIYLNGGSEHRRESREYWAAYARSLNVGFRSYGGYLVVGDPKEAL